MEITHSRYEKLYIIRPLPEGAFYGLYMFFFSISFSPRKVSTYSQHLVGEGNYGETALISCLPFSDRINLLTNDHINLYGSLLTHGEGPATFARKSQECHRQDLYIYRNKNLDNSISSTYQQKDHIWKWKHQIITPRVSDGCNSFDLVCLCVCLCVCYHSPA